MCLPQYELDEDEEVGYSDFIMSISALTFIFRNMDRLTDEFRFKLIYGFDQIVA